MEKEVLEIAITDINRLKDYDPERKTIYKKQDFHISTVERETSIKHENGKLIGLITFFRRSSKKRA
ncbi:MAG TPA: hypothetical protein PKU93_00735 [Candidatus Pacearchaeota archaeon]|nr:hypothetical protein [Candidatus Pacearchaeota archaeon]